MPRRIRTERDELARLATPYGNQKHKPRPCPCGCGRLVTGRKQTYASRDCRSKVLKIGRYRYLREDLAGVARKD